MSIRWAKVDSDRIRSDCWCYWVTRAPSDRWSGGYVYTAAWRPQEPKALGEHLGCHDSGAAAKQACEEHQARRVAA